MEAEVDGLLPQTEDRDNEEEAAESHPQSKAKGSSHVKHLKRARAWALRSVLKGEGVFEVTLCEECVKCL